MLLRRVLRRTLRPSFGQGVISLSSRPVWQPLPPPLSQSSVADDIQRAEQFVMELGYPSEVAAGVVNTLQSADWGLPAGGVHACVERLAGRWEVGEDAGLKALAMAVQREVAERCGREAVSFVIQPANGPPFECVRRLS